MRPDFLYNFIALAPRQGAANQIFDQFFPTMLGVKLSHHVPDKVANRVRRELKAQSELDPHSVHAKMGTLTDQLMAVPSESKVPLNHFLDEIRAV
jgi:hypothetical protein